MQPRRPSYCLELRDTACGVEAYRVVGEAHGGSSGAFGARLGLSAKGDRAVTLIYVVPAMAVTMRLLSPFTTEPDADGMSMPHGPVWSGG